MTLKPANQLLIYFQNLLKLNKLEFLKVTLLNIMKEMFGSLVEYVDTNNGVIKFWKVFSDHNSNGDPTEGLVTYDFYKKDDKRVFFGHYWLEGKPSLYQDSICYLDYSVARGGILAAYSFDDEIKLDEQKFTYV